MILTKSRVRWGVILLCGTILLGLGRVAAQQDDKKTEKRPPRKVKRVARPEFKRQDWDATYFEDLFAEGLVGERPDFGAAKSNPDKMNAGNADVSNGGGEFAWSKVIDRQVIEDEIKRIQIQLEKEVTTPGKFATEYGKARQSFAMLSMLFGIVREYDGDVRFKEYAAHAQKAFAEAAATSRTGTPQAYNKAKQTKLDLQELVRGGKFPTDGKIDPDQNWSAIIDRSPIMERLEVAYGERLKPWTASAGAFRSNQEEVLHEASIVAAMAEVMMREGMLDADDEDYVALSREMATGSRDAISATKANNYDAASKAVNLVGQSCSNCHEDYR